MIKKEIRVIGIDDSSFDKFKDNKVLVIGTFFRGGSFLDGVMSTTVDVDGDDSTSRLIEMISDSKFRKQVQAVLIDGIAVGGFNVIDVRRLNVEVGIPVIVVIRDMPDIDRVKRTLVKLGMGEKVSLIENAGVPKKHKDIYYQNIGLDVERACEILDLTCTRSYIPEAIRVAHLIGAGISKGESRGRA